VRVVDAVVVEVSGIVGVVVELVAIVVAVVGVGAVARGLMKLARRLVTAPRILALTEAAATTTGLGGVLGAEPEVGGAEDSLILTLVV
jgi:hypothetical protein